MRLFKLLVLPGSTVIEIGGHIGYISQFFSKLVGEAGQVVVFEPGVNNLPYIRANTRLLANTQLVEAAISNIDGSALFYLEDLTGQNNSLLSDYSALKTNERSMGAKAVKQVQEVRTICLDTYVQGEDLNPDFIKVDVEGGELAALMGMKNILETHSPILMVEVTENQKEVGELLTSYGYKLFDEHSRTPLGDRPLKGNIFCLHSTKHRELLAKNFF
jgi:FkbM family methyltransferase